MEDENFQQIYTVENQKIDLNDQTKPKITISSILIFYRNIRTQLIIINN